ncbi:MAG: DnaD domain protein [Chloroflexota bacterium]|nr:DnaD domain protein [Chloroflexota bacterium]MDE2884290.1 DnaD domain protein [Chloroflexota bacterium]
MTGVAFPGFGAGTKRLPVPAPLLSTLLADIGDCVELKCTLRFLWFEAQQSGAPKRVPRSALRTDDVLLTALGSEGEIERGITLAIERGTLFESQGWLLLRTPQNERAARQSGPAPMQAAAGRATERPNIFRLYEENVGMLTPLVADELRAAEDEYPTGWVELAIREAVANNVRSWRYIETILERWKREGRGTRSSGKPGGHPEALTAAELLERRRRS